LRTVLAVTCPFRDTAARVYPALNRAQATWKSKAADIFPWLMSFVGIVQAQATQALDIIQGEQVENLLSEKQLALWRWAQTRNEAQFSRRDAIAALGFPPRTVEAIIKRLLGLNRLERIGAGRSSRYRVK
jgi:hypothetical protein